MDWKRARIELIRERHRRLILEPRRQMEYALLEHIEVEEPAFDDCDLAGRFARWRRKGEQEE